MADFPNPMSDLSQFEIVDSPGVDTSQFEVIDSAPSKSSIVDSLLGGAKDFGSGLARGSAQMAALGGDILTYLPRKGLEYATGKEIPSMSADMSTALNQIGLPREDSIVQRVGEFAAPLGAEKRAAQVIGGVTAGLANYASEKLLPDNPIAQTVATLAGGLTPFAAEKTLFTGAHALSPSAQTIGRDVAKEIQTVVPNALTETTSMGQRATTLAKSLEAKGSAAQKQASGLFEALPPEPVNLENAIQRITRIAKEEGAPLGPDSTISGLVSKLQGLSEPAQAVERPASTILDMAGKPAIPATVEIIPGVPAIVPLNETQNILAHIGKLQRTAKGVDRVVLARAKNEILSAAEASVSSESMAALTEARKAWAQMSQTYNEGAVGSARAALAKPKGRLQTLQNLLLNDPKSAKQITSVLSPKELVNARNLMLEDLLQKQPVTWERTIVTKRDSYNAVFGEEGTNNLIEMFSREGTVGKQLLQDNKGLKNLITKVFVKPAAIGGITASLFGPVVGSVFGGLESLRAIRGGASVNSAKSIIMQAAAGIPGAVAILRAPVTESAYPQMLKALQVTLQSGVSNSSQTKEAGKDLGKSLSPQTTKSPSQKDVIQTTSSLNPTASSQESPLDLLMQAVAHQESKEDPNAVSPAGAKGLMQFMPATAKSYGLDNPFDPAASMEAAKSLYGDELKALKDPFLALAAYNAGRPKVNKAIEKAGSRKWEDVVKYLPKETREYVPKVWQVFAELTARQGLG